MRGARLALCALCAALGPAPARGDLAALFTANVNRVDRTGLVSPAPDIDLSPLFDASPDPISGTALDLSGEDQRLEVIFALSIDSANVRLSAVEGRGTGQVHVQYAATHDNTEYAMDLDATHRFCLPVPIGLRAIHLLGDATRPSTLSDLRFLPTRPATDSLSCPEVPSFGSAEPDEDDTVRWDEGKLSGSWSTGAVIPERAKFAVAEASEDEASAEAPSEDRDADPPLADDDTSLGALSDDGTEVDVDSISPRPMTSPNPNLQPDGSGWDEAGSSSGAGDSVDAGTWQSEDEAWPSPPMGTNGSTIPFPPTGHDSENPADPTLDDNSASEPDPGSAPTNVSPEGAGLSSPDPAAAPSPSPRLPPSAVPAPSPSPADPQPSKLPDSGGKAEDSHTSTPPNPSSPPPPSSGSTALVMWVCVAVVAAGVALLAGGGAGWYLLRRRADAARAAPQRFEDLEDGPVPETPQGHGR